MRSKIFNLIVAGVILTSIFLYVILPFSEKYNTQKMQLALAESLGVKISDYPYPDSFPVGYFDAILKPGMSTVEVHKYIQGYDTVFHCEGEFNFEIYNYFSKNKHSWLVLLISYDNSKKYDGHMETSSDSNSRTLTGKACNAGVLE